MTEDIIREAMMKLKGAVTIVYPMNLPPHDPIRMEFEGIEDLAGTQVGPINALSINQSINQSLTCTYAQTLGYRMYPMRHRNKKVILR